MSNKKQYAIITDYKDFIEVEAMLIKLGVPFCVAEFLEGYAFVFNCE